jgi:hypothetical protein
VLLDKLVLFFNQTANSTTARYDTINETISAMMAQVKAAKAERRIDDEFFNRYARVLRILKLKITQDQEEILGDVAHQEYIAFVKAATGKELRDAPSTAVLAQAAFHELANLRRP